MNLDKSIQVSEYNLEKKIYIEPDIQSIQQMDSDNDEMEQRNQLIDGEVEQMRQNKDEFYDAMKINRV